jgi:capsular exopolysaccharide synthesis family protein
MTRIYRANAILLVNQSQNSSPVTYQDILGSQQLTKTYAELVTSNLNLGDSVTALKDPSVTLRDLQKHVSASTETGTQLVHVYAEDPDPQHAAKIANAVAESFVSYVQKAQLAGVQAPNKDNLNTIFVAETAETPRSPVRPNVTLNLVLGLLLGFLVAVAAVAVVEYLDDDIDSREEVERLSLPFLGSIFQAAPPQGGQRQGWLPSIIRDEPNSPLAESFRQVQANLAFALSTKNLKTLVVTSAGAGEGKTTTASNLAEVLSESSKHVLLIDGDLRKPDAHRYFDLPNQSGLTSAFLVDESAAPSFTTRVTDHLSVMTCGPIPPNPSELLNSTKMKALLETLGQHFDLIVVDSPPLLVLADASIWSSLADGILLVARKGKTRRGPFEEAIATARSSQKPIIGVVINGVKRRKSAGYYYGYGYGKKDTSPRA